MPSIKLLILLGAVVALMVGGWQTYRQVSDPRATATIVRSWNQPRYDERSKRMGEEHCIELTYVFGGQNRRSNYCSWDRYLEQSLVVRVDPSDPNVATPYAGFDWFTTALIWTIGPFIGWLALVMYGYAPLHDRFAKPNQRRKRRK